MTTNQAAEQAVQDQEVRTMYFHASDHLFAPGDLIVPGSEIGKTGYSGGDVRDSDMVWFQDDVHEIYEYGPYLYEVEPQGDITAMWEHVYTAPFARVLRHVAATDRTEYVDLANRLARR